MTTVPPRGTSTWAAALALDAKQHEATEAALQSADEAGLLAAAAQGQEQLMETFPGANVRLIHDLAGHDRLIRIERRG